MHNLKPHAIIKCEFNKLKSNVATLFRYRLTLTVNWFILFMHICHMNSLMPHQHTANCHFWLDFKHFRQPAGGCDCLRTVEGYVGLQQGSSCYGSAIFSAAFQKHWQEVMTACAKREGLRNFADILCKYMVVRIKGHINIALTHLFIWEILPVTGTHCEIGCFL